MKSSLYKDMSVEEDEKLTQSQNAHETKRQTDRVNEWKRDRVSVWIYVNNGSNDVSDCAHDVCTRHTKIASVCMN